MQQSSPFSAAIPQVFDSLMSTGGQEFYIICCYWEEEFGIIYRGEGDDVEEFEQVTPDIIREGWGELSLTAVTHNTGYG